MVSVFSNMNPIEHVWDALGTRVADRQPPHKLSRTGKSSFLKVWDRIPQLVINSLIDYMPQMFSTLLAVRGKHTPSGNDFL
ncbi:transposable element Tc1 transposase [Trichonephila clavipes]|uniref:Transposable element Tc1 transposase n=1 Tax=Trichonephila clavipes TaxID=2585209 RepID=A0A8X6SBQ9_TRICX|nr:transposable element Tc1 transposase [Trichonephila clavipes]